MAFSRASRDYCNESLSIVVVVPPPYKVLRDPAPPPWSHICSNLVTSEYMLCDQEGGSKQHLLLGGHLRVDATRRPTPTPPGHTTSTPRGSHNIYSRVGLVIF